MCPQDLDEGISFVARREAQKELSLHEPLSTGKAVTRLYPDHGGRDPVGAATAAQATHEAELEIARDGWRDALSGQVDASADLRTLERLYARAIDAKVTLEKTLTAAQNEANRLLEEKRVLKASLEELVRVREESWEGDLDETGPSQEWLDGSDGRYARARKALGRE